MLLNKSQTNHSYQNNLQDLKFKIIIGIHKIYITFQNQMDPNKNNLIMENNQLIVSNIFNQAADFNLLS